MNSELLWYLVNTLESVSVVATEDNLSKMLASIQLLKKAARATEQSEQGGETDG